MYLDGFMRLVIAFDPIMACHEDCKLSKLLPSYAASGSMLHVCSKLYVRYRSELPDNVLLQDNWSY